MIVSEVVDLWRPPSYLSFSSTATPAQDDLYLIFVRKLQTFGLRLSQKYSFFSFCMVTLILLGERWDLLMWDVNSVFTQLSPRKTAFCVKPFLRLPSLPRSWSRVYQGKEMQKVLINAFEHTFVVKVSISLHRRGGKTRQNSCSCSFLNAVHLLKLVWNSHYRMSLKPMSSN